MIGNVLRLCGTSREGLAGVWRWFRKMRIAMPGSIVCAALWLIAPALCAQMASAPPGWTMAQEGDRAVYRPQNLPENQSFTLTVEPFVSLNHQPLDQWFEARTEADVSRRGRITGTQSTRSPQPGVLLKTEFVDDGAGQHWVILYSGSSAANGTGQFAAMVTNLKDQSALVEDIRAGAAVLGQNLMAANGGREAGSPMPAARGMGNPPVAGSGMAGGKSAASASSVSGSRSEQAANAIRVAVPGSGVPESDIEAVVYEGRGMSTATGYAYVETVHLLLKDGWAYSELDVPPEDLNVEAARRAYPARWHQWRAQGKDFYLQDQRTGQWSRLDATPIRPLEAQLDIHLMHRNSFSFGGMGSVNTTSWITFSRDGSFERARGVLAGSGVVQSAGGFSGSTASVQDRNGTSSSSSGSYSGGGGTAGATSRQQSRSGSADSYGRYKVSGWVLELDLADGQVQRLLAFHPFSDKMRDSIYLGGTTYNSTAER